MKIHEVMARFIGKGVLSLSLMMPCMALSVASCDTVYEDTSDCPRGVSLRFRYDYNMEFADAFRTHVDCLTCYVFDRDGNFVACYTETTDRLKEEGYRMDFPLGAGDYKVVAYGGLECEKSSFDRTVPSSARPSFRELEVRLRTHAGVSDASLHGLYYGTLDFTVRTDDYVELTVPMMKDTNNIRIVLQQLDNSPVDIEAFGFEITDDNALMDMDNNVVPSDSVTYVPWTAGQSVAGQVGDAQDEGSEIVVGYAELSTARLMARGRPRLRIYRRSDGKDVADIPLIDYLLLVKSEVYREMSSQEFLDRQSEWGLIFFLDRGRWARLHIVVNDWVVRINNEKL